MNWLTFGPISNFWAYFLNFLLGYLSLSCSFVSAPYLNNRGMNHNLITVIPFRILIIISSDGFVGVMAL